eukprot:scaffold6615_cov172-Amphora_coffeaeformis.AAC.10
MNLFQRACRLGRRQSRKQLLGRVGNGPKLVHRVSFCAIAIRSGIVGRQGGLELGIVQIEKEAVRGRREIQDFARQVGRRFVH